MHYAFKSLTLIKIILNQVFIHPNNILGIGIQNSDSVLELYVSSEIYILLNSNSTRIGIGLTVFSQIPIMQTEQTHII